MKRTVSLLSAAIVAGLLISGCNNAAPVAATATQADTTAAETKVSGIQSEIDRRGNKLQKDANDFQNKMDKGLLTTSVANAQYQKLQQQQGEYQEYVVRKQQEMQEEQQVMLNQIMNAIAEFVKAYNVEKQYALILTTSGDILPAPVVTGSAALDITDEILAGLNAEYVKTKAAETK